MTKSFTWQPAQESHRENDDRRLGLLEAAEHTRRIIDALVRVDPHDPMVSEVAEKLANVAQLLADRQLVDPPIVESKDSMRSAEYLDRSPVTGLCNPLSPPLEVVPDGQHGAKARVTMGLAYQGPPGRVHGGYVATLLDHVMGYAAGTSGQWVFTRTLTVDYDLAVPLFQELEITGTIDRFDGRKVWMVGQISAGGRVVAKAHGMWVGPRGSAE
ncbi:PaaI family thioesterase [Arthrobacter sp. MYb213]|uniref:PaaI family thioesterase n=1 Tax=Arthrobacter sp. MYb213 TaxID=1848595 RepID=UPI000CFCA13E|nr:PaaI family thioesterase [Arthrobacter sp. MYb213]PRB70402.1 thioesterase [Arthrobacter sp. MYb213]